MSDQRITIRVPDTLRAHIKEEAAKHLMSEGEYLRSLAREKALSDISSDAMSEAAKGRQAAVRPVADTVSDERQTNDNQCPGCRMVYKRIGMLVRHLEKVRAEREDHPIVYARHDKGLAAAGLTWQE
ncbi:MAG TPA: hypothetical protein VMA75_04975 [Candidatus Paceibacterota bacterium]|nr:hypothetical protein [Candidatus Paceibacterota bacterium]